MFIGPISQRMMFNKQRIKQQQASVNMSCIVYTVRYYIWPVPSGSSGIQNCKKDCYLSFELLLSFFNSPYTINNPRALSLNE